MSEALDPLLVGVPVVVALGVGCQLLGPRLRLPPILLLLVVGFAAGNLGAVDTDALLGDALFPLVTLAVGVILFEGALTLDARELTGALRRPLRRLLTVTVLLTWAAGAVLAALLLGLDVRLAVLLGAILVVSGPTVVTPLLGFVGDVGRVGSLLKFEGILVDPVGAILAVLVFNGVIAQVREEDTRGIVVGFALTLGAGLLVGLVAAAVLVALLRLDRGPSSLDALLTLAAVFLSVTAAEALREEAGLVAVTVLGIALANQRFVDTARIEEFKSTLGTLLASVLFILLSARLSVSDISSVGWQGVVFVAALVLVVRPLAVAAATAGSRFTRQERAFAGWVGPRGIVAASTASVFALQLTDAGIPGAERLVPITFVVILGTVLVASLTVVPVAGALGLRAAQRRQHPGAEPAAAAEP